MSDISAATSGRRETARPSIFWPLAALVLPAMGVLARIRIEDAHKLPRTGAFVLSPNHVSEIDPLVVAVAVWRSGRIPRFMAKASLFRIPVVGWLLRRAGQIPVEREGAGRGRDSVGQANELVRLGRGVIIYPEGTLTRDPDLWPMRGKTGAARVAAAGGIPVIPVAHWGVERVYPRYGKLSLFPPRKLVTVRFGDPIALDAGAEQISSAKTMQRETERILTAVTGMLGELRGEEPPAVRWNPADHDQRETGRFES